MAWLTLAASGALFSGISKLNTAFEQASLLTDQGYLAERDYEKKAQIALDEGYRLREQQAMEYISSGVEMIGTPLLTLAETKKKTETQAAELRKTGAATKEYYLKSAKAAKKEGIGALISSVFTAGGLLGD